MNPILSHILSYFLGAISLAVSPIFKNLIYKKTDEKCFYLPPNTPDKNENHKSFDVKVIKYFNRVTHISCHWWRCTQKIKYENISFIYCKFGGIHIENLPISKNKKCRLTKIRYSFIFKLKYLLNKIIVKLKSIYKKIF